MSPTYCCERFREHVSNGTMRGLSIVAKQHPRVGRAFFLRFRAIDQDQESTDFDTGQVILLRQFEQAIQYCPWCGCCLATHYERVFELLPYLDDETVW